MKAKITCLQCGETLDDTSSDAVDTACPKCGSKEKNVTMTIKDNYGYEIHDCIRGKAKDHNYPSKQNPRVDFFQGDDKRKSDGKWMEKERLIDKDNDLYKETDKDPETGQIVHHREEPLSEHKGHGTDKKKKP